MRSDIGIMEWKVPLVLRKKKSHENVVRIISLNHGWSDRIETYIIASPTLSA